MELINRCLVCKRHKREFEFYYSVGYHCGYESIICQDCVNKPEASVVKERLIECGVNVIEDDKEGVNLSV